VLTRIRLYAFEQLDVHVRDSARRLTQTFARWILTNRIKKFTNEDLDAIAVDHDLGFPDKGIDPVEVAIALIDVKSVANHEG
jgi:hypothetical protein